MEIKLEREEITEIVIGHLRTRFSLGEDYRVESDGPGYSSSVMVVTIERVEKPGDDDKSNEGAEKGGEDEHS